MWLVFIITLECFIEIPVVCKNSVDPDQTPCSMASDLFLYCLPVFLFFFLFFLKWGGWGGLQAKMGQVN